MVRPCALCVVLALLACAPEPAPEPAPGPPRAAAVVAVPSPRPAEPTPAGVQEESWVAVRRQEVQERREGVVTGAATTVGAPLAGQVLEVIVAPGERVQRGQPLVRLDATALELAVGERDVELAAAQARLGVAELAIETARAELERDRLEAEAAADAGTRADARAATARVRVAETRLVEVEARRVEARAEVDLARARQHSDRAALQRALILAPVEGVVAAVAARAGQAVAAGAPLVELLEAGPPSVEVWLPGELLPRVQPGLRVQVVGYREAVDRTAVVAQVVPRLEPTTQRFRCVCRLEGDDAGGLVPGAGVVVTVPLAATLVVPRAALALDEDGWSVTVRHADGTRGPRRVRVGPERGEGVEVLDGLVEGEQVRLVTHR